MIDTTVGRADRMKVQTADIFEETARRLREADLSMKGEDIKAILNDAEARINQLKEGVSSKVEPVENFIEEHPLASVAIALGVGYLIGSFMSSMHARD